MLLLLSLLAFGSGRRSSVDLASRVSEVLSVHCTSFLSCSMMSRHPALWSNMIGRVLLFVVALAYGTNAGRAQFSPDLTRPEPCQMARSEALPVLEQRRQSLEREIASKAEARTGPDGKPLSGSEGLRKNQEDLLKVLFQIECLNTQRKLQAVDIPFRGPPATARSTPKADNVIEVT